MSLARSKQENRAKLGQRVKDCKLDISLNRNE